MSVATFYILSDSDASQATEPQALFQAACDLSAQLFRQRKRIWVHCQSQQHAEEFDELLWQRPVDSFVPHNLVGEGAGNSPVEISWQGATHSPSRGSKFVLLNLADNFPEFAPKYQTAYDFVPVPDDLKALARQRYKHYRAAGFQLSTLPAAKINEINNG